MVSVWTSCTHCHWIWKQYSIDTWLLYIIHFWMKNTCRVLLPVSLSVADAGSILKVVSITQENWSTEEVVLEELQVFQVFLRSTATHTNPQNTETWAHTLSFAASFLIDNANCSPAALSGTVDSSDSEIFIMPLLYKLRSADGFFWTINQQTHLLFLLKQCSSNAYFNEVWKLVKFICFTFCRLPLPSSVWRCLLNRFGLILHFIHTLFPHYFCTSSPLSCPMHSVLCICLLWHETYCFFYPQFSHVFNFPLSH